MTREEAIKTLRELWRETNDAWYEEVYNMAIEALSADAIPLEHHRKVLYKTVDQDIEIARLKNRIKELENG